MSRRKQLRPQHVHVGAMSGWESPAEDRCAHVCSRCCAEFSALSDLEQHRRGCSPNPPVLIADEDEDLLSGSKAFPPSPPASPAGEPSETVIDFEMENIYASHENSCTSAELKDCFSSRSSQKSVEIPECSSIQSISGPACQADAFYCTSVFPQYLPQPGCSADRDRYSWMKRNIIIENLESTKVSVDQLSQVMQSDSHQSKAAISSLLQQLLALQIQQIHQLQLIDQIRHQVLLFASHQAQRPETLVIYTRDPSSSKSINQLKAPNAHLSQQLTAASGAECLSTQSANINDIKDFTATDQLNQSQPDSKDVPSRSETSQTFSKLMKTAFHKQVSKKQHKSCGSSQSQLHLSSQSKISSLFSKTSANSNLSPPSSCYEHTTSKTIPNISEIVEDLDGLAALAQQRKCKNLKLSTPTLSPKESLSKRKCRFCNKVLEGNSALQIHLQSHSRERPYQCNICGNRFSTRGNLKFHFQRHQEKYLHIQMNPHFVPVPPLCGMSLSSETAAAKWHESSPSPTTMTPAALEKSISTNLSSLIKEVDYLISIPISHSQGELYLNSAASMDFRSKANPSKTFDSVETRQQRTKDLKSEDIKPSFNFVSTMMTTKSEDSVGVVPNPFAPYKSTSFLSLKCSNNPRLQLPSVTTERGLSDPNECIICHRILSCQSALRMHFRTHTEERPYQCKLCSRAFTTKGNLKTHQAVHRAAVLFRVQHSCPICQRKFTNAVVLQQHVHMHMEGHLPSIHRKNFSNDNNEAFLADRLPRFKSLSFHLSQSPFDKNLINANKKTSYYGSRGELQLKWIKTERPEGSNVECSQTNTQKAAESGQHASTFPTSDSSASDHSLSPNSQASMYFEATRLDEPFQTWHDSTTLTLCASVTTPTDLKLFNHTEDSPGVIHKLRETGFLKNTYCDICGKNFACQSALDIHYRSHTKERPFICTTCNRGFSTKGNLRQHMLTHQMRDFPPHLFEPSNPNPAPNYNGSMLSVGSEAVKTKMAAFLNSAFRNGKDLTSSVSESSAFAVMQPRRTLKQHHCKTCGKSFSSSSALQIHERTHTGERPFACAVCGRAFTTKGNLKVHIGTHMWNNAPNRRGRKLSVDRSLVGFWAPVKLPELPHKNSAMVSNSVESVYRWNQSPAHVKVNGVGVIQGGGKSASSAHAGLRKTPAESTGVCLKKLHHTNNGDLSVVNGRNNS